MNQPHALFPLGMKCSHCYRWLDLGDAIVHRKLTHAECDSCHIEAELAQTLLDEAKAAVMQLEGTWIEQTT